MAPVMRGYLPPEGSIAEGQRNPLAFYSRQSLHNSIPEMYNPYQGQVRGEQPSQGPDPGQSSYWSGDQNAASTQGAQHSQYQPQQQQQQQQQRQQYSAGQFQGQQAQGGYGMPASGSNAAGTHFNTFFSDPAAQMGLQFSQSAFNASQQYMQQNLQQFVSNEDIKYYFKVSNAYVLKKLLLILFPYRNKSWIRQTKSEVGTGNGGDVFATPIEDVNAPDLYIPTMAFLSYILVWALGEGVKGDFHPEMLGYATTRTLAFYIMDFILLRISFYVLGINSKNSKLWDLVSYTGYKFVPILVLLVLEFLTGYSVVVRYIGLIVLGFSLGFFMMRSLRYVVLPGGGFGGESRMRMQYLFAYCFIVQGLFIWLMT